MSFGSLLINQGHIFQTSGSIDRTGHFTYNLSASGVPMRFEYRNERLVTDQGEDTISNARAFMFPASGIDLSAGDIIQRDDQYFKILEVREMQDSESLHHLTVMLRTTSELS